ncbi:MAG TPA: hypothetical protein VF360_03280 [Candidatus Methanoperedens sp.]
MIVVLISGCVNFNELTAGFQNTDPIKITDVKNIENCVTIIEISANTKTKVLPCTLVNLEIKNNQKESNHYLINRAAIVTKDGKQIGNYNIGGSFTTRLTNNNCDLEPGDFMIGFRLFPDVSKKAGMCFPLVEESDNPKLYIGLTIVKSDPENNIKNEYNFNLTPYYTH